MACDLEGSGRCDGSLYRFRGGHLVRCERHVKLQAFWSDLPVWASSDFEDWERSLDPAQEGMILRGRVIDSLYWEEV